MKNANHELRTENKKLAPALPTGSGGGPETLMSHHALHPRHLGNPKYGARAHTGHLSNPKYGHASWRRHYQPGRAADRKP